MAHNAWHTIDNTRHMLHRTHYRTPTNTAHMSLQFWIPDSGFRAPESGFRIWGSGARLLDSGVRVPESDCCGIRMPVSRTVLVPATHDVKHKHNNARKKYTDRVMRNA